jgi:hypothetical protein
MPTRLPLVLDYVIVHFTLYRLGRDMYQHVNNINYVPLYPCQALLNRKQKTCSESSQALPSPAYLATAWGSLRVLPYLVTACECLEAVAEWLATAYKPSQGPKLIQAVASNLAFFRQCCAV